MYTVSNTLRTAINNNTPQRVLLEFRNRSFSNEDILVEEGVELNEEFCGETDLTIGLTPSAEISFTMINEDGQLRNFTFGKFTAWLGARIDSGTPGNSAKTKTFTEGGSSKLYEFTPLGVFIADRPNVVTTKTIDIVANDQMTLFDKDMPSDSALSVTYPITLENLFKKLCTKAGVEYKSSNFLNKGISVPKRPKVFDTATMREVLGWIAEAACSIARFDRDGKLEMAWFKTVNKTFDENDYTEFSPYWYETSAINGLNVRNSEKVVELNTGSGNNKYMILDNPFLTD